MKKKALRILLLILICATMFISGGVAAVTLTAKDIAFTSKHEGWTADNVEDAMNDLYTIGSNITGGKIYKLGTGKSFDISSIVGAENVGNYSETNFLVEWNAPTYNFTYSGLNHSVVNTTMKKQSDYKLSYDETTGVLTITGGSVILLYSKNEELEQNHNKTFTISPVVYFLDGLEVQQ